MSRSNFFISMILEALDLDVPLTPLESPYEYLARKKRLARKQYRDTLYSLKRRGIIEIVAKRNQEFIKVTKAGALKVLLEKAKIQKTQQWDGKWRVLVFDIPEDFHSNRDRFRKLLKQNNFISLQASVFVSPYPLSREAVVYLKEAGLMTFIRILKVEEMDNDQNIRKRFGL